MSDENFVTKVRMFVLYSYLFKYGEIQRKTAIFEKEGENDIKVIKYDGIRDYYF